MKKLDQSISQSYLPIKLYLDDLLEVQRILRESSKDMQLKSSGYSFDSIEEMASTLGKQEVFELEMHSSSPDSRIEFTRLWAKVYVASSAITSAGMFHSIDHVIAKSRRPLSFIYSFYTIWGINIFSIVSTPLAKLFELPFINNLSLGGFVVLFWVLFVRLRRHSTIVLTPRNASRTFWSRNKDEIIIALISATVGALLGILGTVIAKKWF
jgi:hypothetical protein